MDGSGPVTEDLVTSGEVPKRPKRWEGRKEVGRRVHGEYCVLRHNKGKWREGLVSHVGD